MDKRKVWLRVAGAVGILAIAGFFGLQQLANGRCQEAEAEVKRRIEVRDRFAKNNDTDYAIKMEMKIGEAKQIRDRLCEK